MRKPTTTEERVSAAKALQEEFTQLGAKLPAHYHDWLAGLPEQPKLWLLQKDHFTDAFDLIEALRDPRTPIAFFLHEQLSEETLAALPGCCRSHQVGDPLLDSLAEDLNRLIEGGQSLFTAERFANVPVSSRTEALAHQSPHGRALEILNRLLLEEAFSVCIAKVWDTLGGTFAILRAHPRTALCISGGGIRSATFGLGVLQGLARHDLLGEFDYLSTVSGGGYIGSWLSSWIYHEGDARNVFEALKAQTAASSAEPEPKQLRHLRAYSNYLTPKLGLFSADTWTLIGTYLRNLFLNWLVFLPLMVAALAIPRLYLATLRLPQEPWVVALVLAAGIVLTVEGIAYGALQRPGQAKKLAGSNRFWSQRGRQADFLTYCFGPIWLGAVCFTTFWAWLPSVTFEMPPWWLMAMGGAALHLLGWMVSRIALRQFNQNEVAPVILTGGLGGSLMWLLAREAFTNLADLPDLELYVCFAVPAFLLVFLLIASLFIGLGSRHTSDADREWWARMGAWLLIGVVGWSAFSSLVFFGPVALAALPLAITWMGGLPGLVTLLLGYSGRTGATKDESGPVKWTDRIANIALALAAPLFIVFVGALLSLGTTALLGLWPDLGGMVHLGVVHETPLWLAIVAVAVSAGFGLVMSSLININKFTLYSVYRNRLIRAYLGASNPRRNPNPFTGFDPEDNLRFFALEGQRPFHLVNMALNLVSGDNLAWQQRKAETFTASALHVGNYRLGYRHASEYARNEKGRGLSLGSAVTISGAAASPNMGYHSSPIVAALMTLFNVRLGAWLGNPGPAGDKTYTDPAPRSSAVHMLKEAFALTDRTSGYVYLSDGGHFENLGVYEMILRRCQFIVVSDAGCDCECQLEDLGNAIRKIRIDLGVPIEMKRFDIHSRKSGVAGNHCAIGEICYDYVDGPQAKRGTLIYIKPSLTGDEPRDVFNYAQTSPQFPHEPTSDQWFNESQFESYRTLGLHIVNDMCQDWSRAREQRPEVHPLALFARQVFKYLNIPFVTDIEDQLKARLPEPPTPPPRPSSAETPPAEVGKSY